MSGSLGYAERLSWKDDVGGQLGDPELTERSAEEERAKVDQLSEMMTRAARSGGAVVHTGAGISTSTGIPDFRGPNGVWTMQKAGAPLPTASVRFDRARPSFTHAALVQLHRSGYVKYVVSCNVDSLHLRSGLPRTALAELHGNCFAERCERCGREYIRDFEMPSVGFKPTKRRCAGPSGCGGRLRDQVLDWDDALPPDELRLAERHSRTTPLAIVLGSSLQIRPSCDLPLKTTRKRPKPRGAEGEEPGPPPGELAIVNLQKTPKDAKATVVIHAKTDGVMARIVQNLGLTLDPYVQRDAVLVSHAMSASGEEPDAFDLRVDSVHGPGAPFGSWLVGVKVEFECAGGHRTPIKPCVASLGPERNARGLKWRRKMPKGGVAGSVLARFTLLLDEGCAARAATFEHAIEAGSKGSERSVTYAFETDRAEYLPNGNTRSVAFPGGETRGSAVPDDSFGAGHEVFPSTSTKKRKGLT